MKFKYEYKYVIPNEILPELRKLVSPFIEKDPYMEKGGPDGYTVRTIYFDTRNFKDYHEKIEGIKKRKKIRIRGYNNEKDITFLEIKCKDDKRIHKHRTPIKFQDLENLLNSANIEKYILDKNNFEDCQKFFYHYLKNLVKPVVLVVYEREAFYGKFNPFFRLTFDKNLRSSINPKLEDLFEETIVKDCNPDNSILEVKFPRSFPSWLKSIISPFNLKLEAYSKYTQSLDQHNIVKNKFKSYFKIP